MLAVIRYSLAVNLANVGPGAVRIGPTPFPDQRS